MVDLVQCFGEVYELRSVCLPRLDLRARSSISETNWVSQERLSQKPCYRWYTSLFEFRCLTTLEAIMCSSTLQDAMMHVRKMGR